MADLGTPDSKDHQVHQVEMESQEQLVLQALLVELVPRDQQVLLDPLVAQDQQVPLGPQGREVFKAGPEALVHGVHLVPLDILELEVYQETLDP